MFNNHKADKKTVNLAILDASARLYEITTNLLTMNKNNREKVAQEITVALIKLDSSIEVSYAQLYKETFYESPESSVLSKENLFKLGMDLDSVKKVRKMRNTRNKFCHSFDFVHELLSIAITKDRINSFQSMIMDVVKDLHSLRSEIRAFEVAA